MIDQHTIFQVFTRRGAHVTLSAVCEDLRSAKRLALALHAQDVTEDHPKRRIQIRKRTDILVFDTDPDAP